MPERPIQKAHLLSHMAHSNSDYAALLAAAQSASNTETQSNLRKTLEDAFSDNTRTPDQERDYLRALSHMYMSDLFFAELKSARDRNQINGQTLTDVFNAVLVSDLIEDLATEDACTLVQWCVELSDEITPQKTLIEVCARYEIQNPEQLERRLFRIHSVWVPWALEQADLSVSALRLLAFLGCADDRIFANLGTWIKGIPTDELVAILDFNEDMPDRIAEQLESLEGKASLHLEDNFLLTLSQFGYTKRSRSIKRLIQSVLRDAGHSATDGLSIDQKLLLITDSSGETDLSDTSADDGLSRLAALRHKVQNGSVRPVARAKKLRVALCISGQLRGYEAAFASLKEKLIDQSAHSVEFDIFVHVWKEVGRREPMPASAWRVFPEPFLATYMRACEEVGYETIKEQYPNLTAFRGGEGVSVEKLASVYGCPPENIRIDDENDAAFEGMDNPSKMHHKVQACHELAMNSGKEYDLLFRLRPDKGLVNVPRHFSLHRILRACLNAPTIYVDFPVRYRSGAKLVVGDQAAIATPEVMDIYAHSAQLTADVEELDGTGWPLVPQAHRNYAYMMWALGIQSELIRLQWAQLSEVAQLTPNDIHAFLLRDVKDRSAYKWDSAFNDALKG